MKTIRTALLPIFVLATLAVPAAGSSSSDPGTVGDPVFVDTIDIRYLESDPVQVHLVVRGSLPTPCNIPAWEVQQTEAGIDVALWSTIEPGATCVAVLEPVEISIPLGSFETADLP